MIYSAYGVGIDSGFAFEGLPEAFEQMEPTIRVDLLDRDEGDSIADSPDRENQFQGRRVLARSGRECVFDVDGVGLFRMSRGEGRISCRPAPSARDDLLNYWLLRYLIPFNLAMNGQAMFFHGSAVRVADGAAAFLADSHGGKSTLANYMRQQGHALITDDDLLVSADETFMAIPSIPFVRSQRKQEDVGTRVKEFDPRPAPLRKLYLLRLSNEPAGVFPIPKAEAAAALLRHNRFQFIEKLAERFRFCVRLASAVPVFRLTVPRDLSRLPAVRDVILSDLGERS